MSTLAQHEIVITTIADRPELADRLWEFDDLWPEFMKQDMVGDALFWRVPREFPEHVLVATEGDAVVARGLSVPFTLDVPHRTTLPAGGWEQAMVWAFNDRVLGRTPDTASALEITVGTSHLGGGLSHRMVAAMREVTAAAGLRELVAPVRPNRKHREPLTPMAEYVRRVRDDGLPEDPWLRVHVRAGATIDGVCATSMTFGATLEQWRGWTGLSFDEDGDVVVPGALVPVHCRVEHGYAVYVEPNVWMRHRL